MIVTLLGLVISLFAYLIAFPNPGQRRFEIYLLLLVVHLGACIAYWLYSFESAMDAFTYYRDPFGFYGRDSFDSGTYFIINVTQIIRAWLGGSFLDHFLFYQMFGMIGIAFLVRMFGEIAESFEMTVPTYLYGLLLLPGLHFWSSAIGKDAPMFMAICMALWAAFHIQRRLLWFALAVLIMLLIRPHVAAISMGAASTALLCSRMLTPRARLVLAPVAAAALIVVVTAAQQRYNLTLDPSSLSQFFNDQQELGRDHGGGADLSSQPFPMKLFALLYRPLFLDAEGMMGYAASFENAVLGAVTLYILYHWRTLLSQMRNVFFLTYAVAYSGVLIILLALVNYNIGLGQRQKNMAIPVVLVIAATLYLYKRYQARAAATPRLSREVNYAAPASAGALSAG